MKRNFYLIKHFDFFAQDTSFMYEDKERFRSYQGVLISIIILIAVGIIGVMFGQEIYKRKRPLVSQAEQYIKTSTIMLNEWVFFLRFKVGNPTQYFDFQSFKMHYNEKGQIDLTSYENGHKLERCNKSHFRAAVGKLDKDNIESYLKLEIYCVTVPENDLIQNGKAENNSTSLDLKISYCNPNTMKCAKNIEDIRLNTYVQFYFLNSYIDSLDYQNPVKYYFGVLDHQISKDFLKRRFIQIANGLYISDNGWILEDERTTEFIQIEGSNFEINSVPVHAPNDALWINFTSPNFFSKFSRSYMKVQDLFAKVGGIINALMILTRLALSHYLRFNMLISLRKNINSQSPEIIKANLDEKAGKNKNLLIYCSSIKKNELNEKFSILTKKVVNLNKRLNEINRYKEENEVEENELEDNKESENLRNCHNLHQENQIIKRPQLIKMSPPKVFNDDKNTKFENNLHKSRDNNDNKNTNNKNEITNEVNTKSHIYKKQPGDNDIERLKSLNNYIIVNNNKEIENYPQINPTILNEENLVENAQEISKYDENYALEMNVGYLQYLCLQLCCCSKKLKYTIKLENEIYALLDIRNFLNYISMEYKKKMKSVYE